MIKQVFYLLLYYYTYLLMAFSCCGAILSLHAIIGYSFLFKAFFFRFKAVYVLCRVIVSYHKNNGLETK